MKTVSTIEELNQITNGSDLYLTIGNFDGVHTGHQFIISKIKSEAVKAGAALTLMTFIPHPRLILDPSSPFKLLQTYEQRREQFASCGVDYLIELNFNRDLSMFTPDQFLQQYLQKVLNLKKFFLGHDFSFGKNKSGNLETFKSSKLDLKFTVDQLPFFSTSQNTNLQVSSTQIRKSLEEGDVKKASILLGRNFSLKGLVKRGEGRGQKLGFPTANLQISNLLILPKPGVYATFIHVDNMKYLGVSNIGVNPTFTDSDTIHFENHILDFSRDLYGKEVEVEFVKRLRDEMKFETANSLVDQIKSDVQFARILLAKS
jgi:riboflavin kinase/FMN adenylyltransferase